MTRPTFLVIGAMKCGTTSLHYYLRLHPEIQIPAVKELNFFSGPPGAYPYPAGERRVETFAEYERLFDSAYDARGEVSPNYAVHPRRAGTPQRIREAIPDAKLIYAVRDPVERAVSQYLQHVASTGERRSMRDALLEDLRDPESLYICPGLYAMQLEEYLRCFPQESVLVIDQRDLLGDRLATLSGIFRFLGVDESFRSSEFETELLTSREQRTYSRLVAVLKWTRTTPLLRLPRSWRVFMRRSAQRIVSRPLEAEGLDADVRTALQEHYSKDAARFRQLTGSGFAGWSV